MNSRHFVSVLLTIALVCLVATGSSSGRTVAPEKELVTDGSFVHDVGNLHSNVTNWGLIGSCFSGSAEFASAPSAQWPAGSGVEYLWAAGLWVGGVVLGEQLVTTGGYPSEFRPTESPDDTIFRTASGAPGGNRYPWSEPDDDGDGLEDEDILNGLDDDGDGLIDEDFAAIADQHFICRFNDYEAILQENNPDHTPLNVTIVQQSIQWSNDLVDDFVGYEYTITNTGVVDIEQVYLGMFADCDIGPRGTSGLAGDDMAGSVSEMVQAFDGSWVNVRVAYMYDASETVRVDGYVGWVLCGHTTDPAGTTAPAEVSLRTFQKYKGDVAFADGGEPTNDAERYQLLSAPPENWDADSLTGQESDYRVLMSSGPFPSLAPGESISYQVALVVGSGLEGMLINAAEAVLAYHGVDYDRDGDPANGDEFTVHWLLAEDVPVPARFGRIMADGVPGGVELLIEANTAAEAGLSVVRHGGDDGNERIWEFDQLIPTGVSGHGRFYRVVDNDPVGWPRIYELVIEEDGWSQTLGQVSMELPPVYGLELSASPNPFNPLLNLRMDLPEAGHVLLQVFDLRGRLVRTLWDGQHPGGIETLTWNGVDTAGHPVPSSVYEVRLATDTRVVNERVTLVR